MSVFLLSLGKWHSLDEKMFFLFYSVLKSKLFNPSRSKGLIRVTFFLLSVIRHLFDSILFCVLKSIFLAMSGTPDALFQIVL